MYYTNYGVSIFNALEIYVQGLKDYDAMVDLYLDIVAYTDDEVITMTDELSIMSFFREKDVVVIFEAIL